MSQATVKFLKKEFPGTEEGYFNLLLIGIDKIRSRPIFNSEESFIQQLLEDKTGTWHLYFNKREVYFRAIIQVWPTVFLYDMERQLAKAKTYDEYLDTYRESGFGIFLSNTKSLIALYKGLTTDWDECYSSWISGNTRIILPYTPLSEDHLQNGIRNATNQVIVNPDQYHNDADAFAKLIKRQYQLALTEQKR